MLIEVWIHPLDLVKLLVRAVMGLYASPRLA